MNKLISILASTVIAVSAMMTTSGTIKTSADADAFSAATEKTTYTIQDVRNLQGFILAKPTEEDLTDKPYDLNGDSKWNAVDLTLMKRALTEPVSVPISDPPAAEPSGYEPADFKFSGKVYLVGDSTVCFYDENYSKPYDRYGWGMKLAEQYSGVTVNNLALSGRSSRSFLSEQNYQTLKNSLGKGDYLFIQFGHNDEKTNEQQYPGLGTYPSLDWSTLDNTGKDSQGRYSYEYILAAYYINLAKNKGAVPVLVTPITRRGTDGQPNYQQHTPYQQGMINLGKQYNIPVIDMTAQTT